MLQNELVDILEFGLVLGMKIVPGAGRGRWRFLAGNK